jgi:nucleoside-diphosphate-sugar epimerase
VKVFVAGGSGLVGQHLIPQLVQRGHRVTATTTNPDKRDALQRLGADAAVMDGLDPASVGQAVATAAPDVIVNQVTAISMAHAGKPNFKHMDRWFSGTNRLRTEGTDHLLAAAQATGVGHIVAQSYASWNGIQTGGWVKTEDDPLDPLTGTPAEPVSRAIAHLERAVLGAGGAVLRYGGLYGPGATDDQVELIRRRMFPLVGDGAGYNSWIHLHDVATATVLAVEQHATGVFNIVDDEPAPASEWLPYLASCAGAKPPRRVPAWLAKLLAGDVAVTMMTRGRGFSNAKAKSELGWQLRYPSWREGFKEGLA